MDTKDPRTASSEQAVEKRWVDSLWFRIVIITVFGLGVFFRLDRLGVKVYSHDESYTSMYAAGYRPGQVFTDLWDGEEKSAEQLQHYLKPAEDQGILDVLSLLARYSPHQAPLFFALAHYWMVLVGYTPQAIRALAALFGCLSILAMYWLGKELFQSSSTALVAAVLFAISPFHVLFATDARPYSLWTLATILSCAALLRAIHKNNHSTWITYSLTLVLGVYSHQLFLLVAAVHGVYFAGMYLFQKRQRYEGFLLACLFAILVYAPWLYFVITRWQQAARQVDVLTMPTSWFRLIQRWILLFSSPLIDLDFNSDTANLAPYFLRVLILLFTAYAFLYLLRHGLKRETLFITLIYAITVGSLIALDLAFGGMRSITGRYFVPANIATLLVLAFFLTARLSQSSLKAILQGRLLFILLILAGIFSNLNILRAETWWNKELSRIRTEFIREIDKDQTLLIVSGIHPTNLGDVLLLGFEVDSDVRFRLYQNPDEILHPENYRYIYWFPGSPEEARDVSQKRNLRITEVLAGILWRIDGQEK